MRSGSGRLLWASALAWLAACSGESFSSVGATDGGNGSAGQAGSGASGGKAGAPGSGGSAGKSNGGSSGSSAGTSSGGSGGSSGSGGSGGGAGTPDSGPVPIDAGPRDTGVACPPLTADCDPVYPGCETNIGTSLLHCGGCNRPCPGSCQQGTCIPPKILFVSSRMMSGKMGGLSGADQACTDMARAAGLTGAFKAWLSDATGAPATRMTKSPGPYRLTNGEHIADSWNDLVDGSVGAPIDRDERGLAAPSSGICEGGEVWSNTTAAGLAASPTNCGDWNSISLTSTTGNWLYTDARWTNSGCIAVGCSSQLSIYCVEQ